VIVRPPTLKASKTGKEQDWRERGNIERQYLHDQSRADIRTEHHRQAGNEIDKSARCERGHEQAGGRAALQECGHANSGKQRQKSVVERRAEEASQARANRAHDSAADHVQAPKQEGNAAHKIEKNQTSHALLSCDRSNA
jgi:hypothetical protein